MITEKQKAWLVTCLIIVIGSVIYANSLDVPFHFDDADNIKNPNLRIEKLDYGEFQDALTGGTLKSRPVSNFSFALNYYFGGYKVQGYHLVNIFIHICAAIILFHFVRLTLSFSPNSIYRHKNSVALFTALLWLTHPLATQSVTYIVQRMNSMAAMFYLLALLLYVLGRREQLASVAGRSCNKLTIIFYFIASGIGGALAMGSKEIAATLPIVIFLYEWFFIQDLSLAWLKKRAFWILGVVGLILVVLYIYTDGHILQRTLFSGSRREFTTWERVLTQFRVVVHYIGLMVFPHPSRLVLDYNIPFSTSFFSPITTLYAFFFLGGLFSTALAFAKRERLISFSILWFFINLAIESSIIGLELAFEHRTYLPSIFLILLLVALAYRLVRHTVSITVLLILVTSLFSYWTVERNKVWQTSLALWADSVSKYPTKARPHSNLGLALMKTGDLKRAEEQFKLALAMNENRPIPHYNLATLYMRQGKKQQAEYHYIEAIRYKADYSAARFHFGILLREKGQYAEAASQFDQALKNDPDNRTIIKNLGNALLRSGHPDKALPWLEKARSHGSDDSEVLLDIGESLTLLGRFDEAVSVYREILEKDRGQFAAHYNLAILLKQSGLEQEALSHYKEADRLMRYPVALKYDLGNLFFRLGELSEAEKTYKEFLETVPTVAMTYNNLGLVLVNQGRFQEAIRHFQAALKIAPSFQVAAVNMQRAMEQLEEIKEKSTSGVEKPVPLR